MKTLLILITSILLFSSCGNMVDEPIVHSVTEYINSERNGGYKYKVEFYNGAGYTTMYTNKIFKAGDLLTKSINPRSYQIQIEGFTGILYNGDKLIGKFKLLNTQLDSLITKDNK